ncbi:ImmA/IrrE family metallo-endopeptidase [Asticcacaulis tiandongensis]|uniref:ImmA/IrrE family metallo-endopeptidase n=1 Tax=Asticcacaulis tiandongensis TaxID=2565365 RepID=UPI0011287A5A|nr:ImmA/IrrE family metallo-endopeptidase [Asticcacaulis tiandongensis]
MTASNGPERWAFELTHVLNAAYGTDRFPVDIITFAQDYSRQRFGDEPIVRIVGEDLPGFEGALYRLSSDRKGWAVIYNSSIRSKGRINFTLAHEFGHYLLHRTAFPDGLRCGQQDIVRWDSDYGQIEHQANVFASNILMPLDDYRRQIPDNDRIDLDEIKACAARYGVSLVAATLRWLGYTQKRAVLVVARDGYILWSRSSEAALKSGAFFRTAGAPVEIPISSLAASPAALLDGEGRMQHGPGVWLAEPVEEFTIFAELYDFSLSLLMLDDRPTRFYRVEEEGEMDLLDKMRFR